MTPEIKTAIPGPKSRILAEELRRYESRNITFTSPGFPVFWQHAAAAQVWDVDGNRFLDLTSGFGVASLGYTPAPVVAAARAQLGELYHAMGDVHPARVKVELCRELSRLTFENWGLGVGKTILTNSGAEAVEAALKTAFIATGKRGVLAFHRAYHGLGYGALTATGLTEFRTPFEAQLADFAHFALFPDGSSDDRAGLEKAWRRILARGDSGAIIVEPIQGRAGVVIPPRWFLPVLRRLADEFGVLLIFDEIYTGFYRTGRRFACDHDEVKPDLVCLGKALTSGFPLAACVGRAVVMDAWPESTGEALHTSTFLGNPLGCRMALAALALLEDDVTWSAEVTAKGEFLLRQLEELCARKTIFRHARGRGLLAAVEIVDHAGQPDAARAGQIVEQGLARGLILLSGGVAHNVLTFTPPFVIEREELAWAVAQIAALAHE